MSTSYDTFAVEKKGRCPMTHVPYIGITGFTHSIEVQACLSLMKSDNNRRLMVGVLATHKTLRGLPTSPRWAAQMPDISDIPKLFVDHPKALNLVHYSTEEGKENTVGEDLWNLSRDDISGPHFHGFQLNIAWPSVVVLERYRRAFGAKQYIVLQIGEKAKQICNNNLAMIIQKLHPYVGLVDAILLDPSSGRGTPFDPTVAYELLTAIRSDFNDHFDLGVAGGLGPDTLNLIEPLVGSFPLLNIDAQGQLRDPDNELDFLNCEKYLTRAQELLK